MLDYSSLQEPEASKKQRTVSRYNDGQKIRDKV